MATFQFNYYKDGKVQNTIYADFEFLVDVFHYAYERAAENDEKCSIIVFNEDEYRMSIKKVADIYLQACWNEQNY